MIFDAEIIKTVGAKTVGALKARADQIAEATALEPAAICLPEHMFPGLRHIYGWRVVRGKGIDQPYLLYPT